MNFGTNIPGTKIVPLRFRGEISVKPYPIDSSGQLCLVVDCNRGCSVILLTGEVGKDEQRFERLAENLNIWHKEDSNQEGLIYEFA